MEKSEIHKQVQSASKDGKIACKQAFALAIEVGLSPKELGQILNELKIKIISCQLGCFP